MSNIGKLEVSSIIIYYYSFLIGYASGEEGVSCLKPACLVQKVCEETWFLIILLVFAASVFKGNTTGMYWNKPKRRKNILSCIHFLWNWHRFFNVIFLLYIVSFIQPACLSRRLDLLSISVFWCWKFNPNPTMLTLGLILRDRK